MNTILARLFQLDLFGESPAPTPAPPPRAERRASSRTPSGWMLADHACRSCMGRVLVRMQRGKVIEARCAECGSHAMSDHTSICCCGAEAGTAGRILECIRNPKVSPAVPQEVLVRERAVDVRPLPQRIPKPVGGSGY